MYDLGGQEFLKSNLAPGVWRLFPMVLLAFLMVLFVFSSFSIAFCMVLKAPGGSLKTFAGKLIKKYPTKVIHNFFNDSFWKTIQYGKWKLK